MAKFPYGSISVRRNFLTAKFPTAQFPTANFPTAKIQVLVFEVLNKLDDGTTGCNV